GILLAPFGIKVLPIVALDVGGPVEIGDLRRRIIPNRIRIYFDVGRTDHHVVPKVGIFGNIKVGGVPAGNGVGGVYNSSAPGIGAHTALHIVGEVVGGQHGIAIHHAYIVGECRQLGFGHIMQFVGKDHRPIGLGDDHL